jgi:polysaccharide export outer membrane protein
MLAVICRCVQPMIALLLILGSPFPASAAEDPTVAAPPADSPQVAARAPRRLVELGPGDSVNIQVYGQPDMTGTVNIADDGRVPVALIGSVSVGGLSPTEAAHKIEQALQAGRFLVEPHVTIAVVQSRSQRVSVLGEVKAPGRYPIDAGTTVFDLLAQAGGATLDASDVAYILRPNEDGDVERFPVYLRGSATMPASIASQTLQSGDSLLVPKADQFSIYGEVARPDIYRIEQGMTVIQAIVRAGGVTARGSERRVEIKRRKTDGTFQEFSAKASDLVKPGDILRVKESIFCTSARPRACFRCRRPRSIRACREWATSSPSRGCRCSRSSSDCVRTGGRPSGYFWR